jgi:hypothetical protein
MGGIRGCEVLFPGAEQTTEDFAEAIAAVGHRQETEGILRPRLSPAARDRCRGGSGGERSFKFVRND